MKKSHLIVLSLAAVMALSACERRQRPKPPPADQTTDADQKKTDGSTTTDLTEETDKTDSTDKTDGKDPAEPTAAMTLEDFNKKVEEIVVTHAVALQEQKLGIESTGVEVEINGKKKTIHQFKGLDWANIDEQIKERSAAGGEDRDQPRIAEDLHKAMIAASAPAKALAALRNEDKSLKLVVSADGKRKLEAEAVEQGVRTAEALLTQLIELDAKMHGSVVDPKEPCLK